MQRLRLTPFLIVPLFGAGLTLGLTGPGERGPRAPAAEVPAAPIEGDLLPQAEPLAPPAPPVEAEPAPAMSQPDSVAEREEGPRACPEGMVLVEGEYCPYVGHRCLEWIDEKRDRCKRYDEHEICQGHLQPMRFCIDRYEYPNQAGATPAVMVNWLEASQACEAEGKRLCRGSEWTFACEGVERLPYPYGYERDASACNIDRPHQMPDFEAFSHDRQISAEVSRLDQRVASGQMDRCVSPFGVHDMTGNVDEWVLNESAEPDAGVDVSGLKGGYYGPIRGRCRPMTQSHNRWFRFYQVGFRCCGDADDGAEG